MKGPFDNMLTQTISRAVNRQGLALRQHGPTISFGVGIGGVIVGTFLACKATLRLEKTLDDIKEEVDTVKTEPITPTYTTEDQRHDLMRSYGRGAAKLIKLYAPAVGVQVISVGLLTGSHVTLKRRNTNLMIAYTALEAAFKRYRDQVEANFGEQIRELEHRDRIDELLSEEEKESLTAWSTEYSPYARFFDETSFSWEKNAELNRIFIEATQGWANNKLLSQGYLFLNDVYRALGMEESGSGQVVGWVLSDGNANHVDFGLLHARNKRFLNLEENACILDFNVDGLVFDKINPRRRGRVVQPKRYVERGQR